MLLGMGQYMYCIYCYGYQIQFDGLVMVVVGIYVDGVGFFVVGVSVYMVVVISWFIG